MTTTYTETRACTSWSWTVEDLLIDWWTSNIIYTSIENLWYSWDMWEYQIYDLWLSI